MRNKSIKIKQEENLRTYTYKSVDRSILSRLFFKKYTNFVLTHTPTYISPNMLTFLGYFAMLSSFVIDIINDITLCHRENWIVLCNAACLAFYFTMDNVDGAQARRLNQMSQLGQLLDHGVDSCVVFFSMIEVVSSLRLGYSYTSLSVIIAVMYGFYNAGLEEKFTGVFELGYISGPTEGLLCVFLLHLFSAFYDTKCTRLMQCITYSPYLAKLVWFVHVSPLFLLSVFVFTYNLVTSLRKSLKMRSKGSMSSVIVSFILPCTLILPLMRINRVFIYEAGYQMLNLMIFAQIFSLRYIQELFYNMIGMPNWCMSISYVFYMMSSFLDLYMSINACRAILIILFVLSTCQYISFVRWMMLYCKRVLNINLLFNK